MPIGRGEICSSCSLFNIFREREREREREKGTTQIRVGHFKSFVYEFCKLVINDLTHLTYYFLFVFKLWFGTNFASNPLFCQRLFEWRLRFKSEWDIIYGIKIMHTEEDWLFRKCDDDNSCKLRIYNFWCPQNQFDWYVRVERYEIIKKYTLNF